MGHHGVVGAVAQPQKADGIQRPSLFARHQRHTVGVAVGVYLAAIRQVDGGGQPQRAVPLHLVKPVGGEHGAFRHFQHRHAGRGFGQQLAYRVGARPQQRQPGHRGGAHHHLATGDGSLAAARQVEGKAVAVAAMHGVGGRAAPYPGRPTAGRLHGGRGKRRPGHMGSAGRCDARLFRAAAMTMGAQGRGGLAGCARPGGRRCPAAAGGSSDWHGCIVSFTARLGSGLGAIAKIIPNYLTGYIT